MFLTESILASLDQLGYAVLQRLLRSSLSSLHTPHQSTRRQTNTLTGCSIIQNRRAQSGSEEKNQTVGGDGVKKKKSKRYLGKYVTYNQVWDGSVERCGIGEWRYGKANVLFASTKMVSWKRFSLFVVDG